nr:MBL fold metallo-hydrolase [bacterium]
MPLYSGSSGNCTLVSLEEGYVLVDCGVSARQCMAQLRLLGIEANQLSGILITHDHGDHLRGVPTLAHRAKVPVYATPATLATLDRFLGHPIDVHPITPGKPFCLAGATIRPFALPHDAIGTVGYRIDTPRESVAVATDLGHMPEGVLDMLCGCSRILLEFNHDIDLLKSGPYPRFLKARIASSHGHLSNADAAQALCTLAENGLTCCFLGHLSQENNTPQRAISEAEMALLKAGFDPGRVRLIAARPDGPPDMAAPPEQLNMEVFFDENIN